MFDIGYKFLLLQDIVLAGEPFTIEFGFIDFEIGRAHV